MIRLKLAWRWPGSWPTPRALRLLVPGHEAAIDRRGFLRTSDSEIWCIKSVASAVIVPHYQRPKVLSRGSIRLNQVILVLTEVCPFVAGAEDFQLSGNSPIARPTPSF